MIWPFKPAAPIPEWKIVRNGKLFFVGRRKRIFTPLGAVDTYPPRHEFSSEDAAREYIATWCAEHALDGIKGQFDKAGRPI